MKTIYKLAEYAIMNDSAYNAANKSINTYFKKKTTLAISATMFVRIVYKVNAKRLILFLRLSSFWIVYTLSHISHFRFKESGFILTKNDKNKFRFSFFKDSKLFLNSLIYFSQICYNWNAFEIFKLLSRL